MEQSESDTERDVNRKRRTVVRGIGVVGLGGTFGVGQAAAKGGPNQKGGGPPKDKGKGKSEHSGGGPPQTCDCPDGTFIAKYEFDGDGCEFVFEKGEDVIDITVTETKGGDCEPIGIEYSVSGFDVENVCAFGGTDTATDDDPDGTFDETLTNPGGQRAAISNITFCGEESEEPDPELVCFQGDLVGGEPIEEFAGADEGYSDEGRLLDYLFGCSDDEEASNGRRSSPDSATVDGETCDFDWDAFAFDPGTQELTAENLTLTSTTSDTGECVASIAAYQIDPDDAKEGDGTAGDLTEQEFIGAETVTLEENETQTITLDLSGALP